MGSLDVVSWQRLPAGKWQQYKHMRSRLLGGWTAVPATAVCELTGTPTHSLHNRHLIMLKHIRQHYERTDPQVGGASRG